MVIDTSDTVSAFQETVLKWDIGSLAETIIDTSTFIELFHYHYHWAAVLFLSYIVGNIVLVV